MLRSLILATTVLIGTSAMADETILHANEWTVTEIREIPVAGATPPTLQFSSDNRASGFGGCNRFNTQYTFTDDGSPDGGTLTFGLAAATMMACPEPQMTLEREMFAALEAVASVSADGERSLVLRDAAGAPVLRLMKTA